MENPNKDNILRSLGLASLPPEQQEKVLAAVSRIIFEAVLIRVLEQFTKEEREDFEKFLESHSKEPEAMFEYLNNHVKNFDQLMAEEIEKFKTETGEMMNNI
jgi:hypothetical protein